MTTPQGNVNLEEAYKSLSRDATFHGRDRRQSQPFQNVPEYDKIKDEVTDHAFFKKDGAPHLAVEIDNGRRVVRGSLSDYDQEI